MRAGAIVVVGAEDETSAEGIGSAALVGPGEAALLSGPLAGCEILGRSAAERIVERFLDADIEIVSVIVDEKTCGRSLQFRAPLSNVMVQVVSDVYSAIADKLNEYSKNGIAHSFVCSADAYTETDLLDLFYFHREARQPATRAYDGAGTLPLWVVDCSKALRRNIADLLQETGRDGVSYFIREYVHRFSNPRDLRSFAHDMLHRRCHARPSGREVRPGLWLDDGAVLHRRSRVVAPAYIGRRCHIEEDTLITCGSSVERDCRVGYGTVLESSSILAHTHVGIWLDVSDAVVNGHKLFSLEHDVVIEIFDPKVMGSTIRVLEGERNAPARNESRKSGTDLREELEGDARTPSTWQLGANLIQE